MLSPTCRWGCLQRGLVEEGRSSLRVGGTISQAVTLNQMKWGKGGKMGRAPEFIFLSVLTVDAVCGIAALSWCHSEHVGPWPQTISQNKHTLKLLLPGVCHNGEGSSGHRREAPWMEVFLYSLLLLRWVIDFQGNSHGWQGASIVLYNL